jgi:hypothetical protein
MLNHVGCPSVIGCAGSELIIGVTVIKCERPVGGRIAPLPTGRQFILDCLSCSLWQVVWKMAACCLYFIKRRWVVAC